MDAVVAIVLALAAIVAGVVVGWLLANRSGVVVKGERDEARAAAEYGRVWFNEAIVNLASEA